MTALVHVTEGKPEFRPTAPNSLKWFTSPKEKPKSSQPCPKDWIGSHHKRKDLIDPNKAQKTELVHVTKGKTECTPTMLKRFSSRPGCVRESSEVVYITKRKTVLVPIWLSNKKHTIGAHHKRKQ